MDNAEGAPRSPLGGGGRPSAGAKRRSGMMDDLRIVPANEASCEDLDRVFGARGAAATCRCQRYKLQPKESFPLVRAGGTRLPAPQAGQLRSACVGHHERPIPGKLLVVWDGAPIHRAKPVKDFLIAGAAKRLQLEQPRDAAASRRGRERPLRLAAARDRGLRRRTHLRAA